MSGSHRGAPRLRGACRSRSVFFIPTSSALGLVGLLLTGVCTMQGTARAALAQAGPRDPVLVTDALSCPQCTIVVRPLLTLGTTDGPGSISVGLRGVRVDSHGRYWVLAGDEPPIVFDTAGRFVRRVGRTGRGPGEFVRPREAVAVAGDSMLVVDGGTMRALLVGRDLRPGRAISLSSPFAPLLVQDWPSRVIGNGSVTTPAGSGWPLHSLSFAGRIAEVLDSFGPGDGAVTPGAFARISQQLAPARAGGFWSADYLRYRITVWARAGEKKQVFDRQPRWFAQPSQLEIGGPTRPPEPAISAIAEDDDGLLWIFVRIPSSTWRDAWPRTSERAELDYRSLAYEKLFRTMVEVLDPRAARIVARHEMNAWVVSALPGRRAAVYTTDADDIPRIQIIGLQLSGR